MEFTEKVIVKLDEVERNNLLETIALIDQIHDNCSGRDCSTCPFIGRCNDVSDIDCLLHTIARDLKYINDHCY